jgi:hypothetical protein
MKLIFGLVIIAGAALVVLASRARSDGLAGIGVVMIAVGMVGVFL